MVQTTRVQPWHGRYHEQRTNRWVWQCWRASWPRHGYGPSVRDLERVMGTESTATVHYWLVALEAEGLITRVPGVSRSVRVVG